MQSENSHWEKSFWRIRSTQGNSSPASSGLLYFIESESVELSRPRVSFGSKPGLAPWEPHVRFRREQTLVREVVRWSSCAILLRLLVARDRLAMHESEHSQARRGICSTPNRSNYVFFIIFWNAERDNYFIQ